MSTCLMHNELSEQHIVIAGYQFEPVKRVNNDIDELFEQEQVSMLSSCLCILHIYFSLLTV